jgi:hypothetical protein
MFLILLTAREGRLCRNRTLIRTRDMRTRPSLRPGVAADVRANVETGALVDHKTGQTAAILFRHCHR